MANQADIKAVITAEDKASGTLKGFSDNVEGMNGKLAGVTKVLTDGLLAAGAAAIGFGVLSVKAFEESENVQAQLAATLKSTHNAAGLYIEDLNDQAKALQRVTRFSDEQIGTSQALLLSFTNIHGAVFQQATPAILDLATAMHEDLQSASVQVGKALNDPLTGITALHRVGVTFSDTQKEQIQHFMDINDLAGAQGIILGELNKEFGGSAQAAGKTFAGQLDILKNAFNDLQEGIGKTIVQGITPLIQRLANTVSSKEFANTMQRVGNVISELFQIIIKILPVLAALFSWLERHRVVLAAVAGIVGIILVQAFVAWAIAAAQAAIATIAATWPLLALGAAIGVVAYLIIGHWNTIKHAFSEALDWIKSHWVLLVDIMLGPFGIIITTIITHFSTIKGWVSALIGWFADIPGKIASLGTSIGNALLSPFKWAFDEIAKFWNNTVGKLHFKLPDWVPGIGGKGFDMPDLPVLDTGGIVSQPTLAMLAMNSRPEAVVPLDKAGGLGGVNITIQAGAFMGSQIDARKYATQIITALQDAAMAKNTTVSKLIGVSP